MDDPTGSHKVSAVQRPRRSAFVGYRGPSAFASGFADCLKIWERYSARFRRNDALALWDDWETIGSVLNDCLAYWSAHPVAELEGDAG